VRVLSIKIQHNESNAFQIRVSAGRLCGARSYGGASASRAGVAEAVAAAGVPLRYLPPYSPDYNPIEFAWSKVEARLRTRAARTRVRLYRALGSALQTITPQVARAWLRHDRYD